MISDLIVPGFGSWSSGLGYLFTRGLTAGIARPLTYFLFPGTVVGTTFVSAGLVTAPPAAVAPVTYGVDFHVGDVGTALMFRIVDQAGVAIPLTGYTSLLVLIGRPAGGPLLKPAIPVTDGSDGLIQYLVGDGDFNAPGRYSFQAEVVIPQGRFHTLVTKKKVLANVGGVTT